MLTEMLEWVPTGEPARGFALLQSCHMPFLSLLIYKVGTVSQLI